MVAIFNLLITQLNSSVFILLALLVLFTVGVWITASRLGSWTEKNFHRDEEIKKLGSMRDFMIELKTKVGLIYENTNPRKIAETHSPISLTPLGEKISNKIEATEIFERLVLQLKEKVSLENPKNAYDIQTISMKIAKETMLELLNEKELIVIKDEAFSEGVIIEDIMIIFGILLRNCILKEKGLPISDVDRHNKTPK
jgi:hypothetical protein